MRISLSILISSLLIAAGLTTPARAQWAGCAENAVALDMSRPATPQLLEEAKKNGIRVIIRYYDWDHRPGEIVRLDKEWEHVETLCGKIPKDKLCGEPLSESERATVPPQSCGKVISPEERQLIHAHGLDIALVFQHRNNCTRSWEDSGRGEFDAKQALAQAQRLAQPAGTAIYFGVDGADARYGQGNQFGREQLTHYFRQVSRVFEGSGYEIGVYGSGFVCSLLKDRLGIAHYCWLSQSPGHPMSRDYEARGAWDLKQCRTKANFGGSGVDVDPNVTSVADFGQWRAGR